MSASDWYGLGFAFPPLVDPETGTLGTIGDTGVVAQALRMLLRTAPGERLMRPDYGCDLRRYLFAPNDASTRRLIANEVSRAINLYEDRVRLTGVDVTADDVEPAQVNVVVRYTLRRTGTPGTFSQPFRLDGGSS
jgi:phage baseplate assembly protein W